MKHKLVIIASVLTFAFFFVQNASAQWTQMAPYGENIGAFAVSGSNLFAGDYYDGVLLSTDNGISWNQVNTGLTNTAVFALAAKGNTIYSGTQGGVFRSTNNGTSWVPENDGLTNISVWALALYGKNIFAGTRGGGIFRSTDSGTSWTAIDNGLMNDTIQVIIDNGSTLFAGTYDNGIFSSTDSGASWTAVNIGLSDTTVFALAASGSNLFAGTGDSGVYLSTNNGASWSHDNSGLASGEVTALAVSDTSIFAGIGGYNGNGNGVFRSTDNGASWTPMSTGLSAYTPVTSLAVSGANLFAGSDEDGGAYLSTDNGAHWTEVIVGPPHYSQVTVLAKNGANLYAGINYIVSGTVVYQDVYRTTNNGTSWTDAGNGLASSGRGGNPTTAIVASDTSVSSPMLFAGTSGGSAAGGVFRSTDNGSNWTEVNSGLTDTNVLCLAVSGVNTPSSILFAGTYGGGVFRSTDNGGRWTAENNGLSVSAADTIVQALALTGTDIFAGTYGGVVHLSTDNGTSWSNAGSLNGNIWDLTTVGANLYAGTDGGVYLTTNNGTSWTPVSNGLTNAKVYAFAVNGTNLFAGTDNGVYLSTNRGTSWTQVDTGLTTTKVFALAVNGSYLYAGTDQSVWRRPLSEMIGSSAVEEQPMLSPAIQTYPNPLTQSTKISFILPESGAAELTMVNLLGAPVARLFSGSLSAGAHSFEWDAGEAAAGTYFCALRTSAGMQRVALVVDK